MLLVTFGQKVLVTKSVKELFTLSFNPPQNAYEKTDLIFDVDYGNLYIIGTISPAKTNDTVVVTLTVPEGAVSSEAGLPSQAASFTYVNVPSSD